MAAVATFDDFCRAWPMRSDNERAAGYRAFVALPAELRDEAVEAAGKRLARAHLAGLSELPEPSGWLSRRGFILLRNVK